jgi:hypothetical protein
MRYLLNRLELCESDLDISKPWTMSGSMWLSAKGIHEPWMFEISPFQYARMSKSQKNSYDKKRNKEWDNASKGKAEWAKAVYNAFKNREFNLNDKDVHPDAINAAKIGKSTEDNANKETALKKALKENRIMDASILKNGDKVFSVIYRRYGEVVKTGKKSVRVDMGDGNPVKIKAGMMDWLSYDDLKKKTFGK